MTQQFGTPGIEDLVDGGTAAHPEETRIICGYEYVPGLSLIVVIVARDGHRPPQITYVVVLLASDIKAHEVTRAHILVQVIVSRERRKRARQYGIVPHHGPGPERGT